MPVRYFLLLLLLLLRYGAYAQFSDSVHYHAVANLAGNINTTDQGQNMVFNNSVRLEVRKKKFELNNNSSWIYGLQQKQLTNNDVNSTLDFNRYFQLPHFNYWGLGNYTSSYSLKIRNQYQAGAGLAYNLIDKKKLTLKISDGLLLESSDVLLSDTIRNQYSTWRNSLRITAKGTIAKICTINASGFWQPSLNNGFDYIIKTNIAASIKIKKWFSFTTAFVYNRFNLTGKENTLFTYGITLEGFF